MTDLQAIKKQFDLLALLEQDLGAGRQTGRWVRFHCPFPEHRRGDADPSLAATPDNGRYHCFTCGRSGDALTWLLEYRGLDWRAIINLAGSGADAPAGPGLARTPPKPAGPPSPAWQARGRALVEACEAALWGEGGEQARAYLHKRGLRDETIKRWRLGYNPVGRYDLREVWDLPSSPEKRDVWLPKGIIIPWLVGGSLWAVNVRRPTGDPKYFKIPGSQAALFGADDLRGCELVLLTEGEFDCILASQELGDVIGVASLGSASKHLDLASWGAHLLPARAILLAYDQDPSGAGGLARLAPMSERMHTARVPVLRPGGKDLTDYHQAGGDLWAWLRLNLERLGLVDRIAT
jgi:DNA primase